ncbi:MAG: glycosyltransferase family 4 protein [Prolixibacteraceae bacterium]|nr:glycosyltransferase family 4 protein [Prolixibacteraceae bacterium]
MRIYILYYNFKTLGGAQLCSIDLAMRLLNTNDKIIALTTTPLNKIHSDYDKYNITFKRFSFWSLLKIKKEDLIFCNDRKLTSLFVAFLFFTCRKRKSVYIARNTYDKRKLLSFFPKTIVAISSGVKDNLISYFHVKPGRITIINDSCVDNYNKYKREREKDNYIKILFPANITKVKRQIEVVKTLKYKINKNIKIDFAGDGPLKNELIKVIGDSKQFKVLGYINVFKALPDCDYVCMFSLNEGLGLSLIEGCMFYKPLITNNIKSVLEVNKPGFNGFIAHDFNELPDVINSLPDNNSDEYKKMAKNARKIYENNFTPDIMLKKYHNLINNL